MQKDFKQLLGVVSEVVRLRTQVGETIKALNSFIDEWKPKNQQPHERIFDVFGIPQGKFTYLPGRSFGKTDFCNSTLLGAKNSYIHVDLGPESICK